MKMYTKELVKTAKRENNNKRNFLLVNPLQAKHIASNPDETLKMFSALSALVKPKYENPLVIGFAETATAIGAKVAADLGGYYIQTTREDFGDEQVIFFTESHSHATEQKLLRAEMDKAIEKTSQILFVEDELTTGNTILKIIKLLRSIYGENITLGVVSILNGMDREHLEIYSQEGISLDWLVKISHKDYEEKVESLIADGDYIKADLSDAKSKCGSISIKTNFNPRRLTDTRKYLTELNNLNNQIFERLDFSGDKNILVLGTQELMFPAIYFAEFLQDKGFNTLSHSTTRSPIATGKASDYPLHIRYELKSMYDPERTVYIYDLKKYDHVVVITDAKEINNSLINALKSVGNEKIDIVFI